MWWIIFSSNNSTNEGINVLKFENFQWVTCSEKWVANRIGNCDVQIDKNGKYKDESEMVLGLWGVET